MKKIALLVNLLHKQQTIEKRRMLHRNTAVQRAAEKFVREYLTMGNFYCTDGTVDIVARGTTVVVCNIDLQSWRSKEDPLYIVKRYFRVG